MASKLSDLDSLIQNQYDILSVAVKNIMAVSSEQIYTKYQDPVKELNKRVKYVSSDNVCEKENSFSSLIEDLEFEEALCRLIIQIHLREAINKENGHWTSGGRGLTIFYVIFPKSYLFVYNYNAKQSQVS